MLNLKYDYTNNGHCQVHYRDGEKLYCMQLVDNRTKAFRLLSTSKDGEASCPIKPGFVASIERAKGDESTDRELNAYLANIQPKDINCEYRLEIAGEGCLYLSGNGQGLQQLERDPVAQTEKPPATGWCDTSHLSRYDGTDFVQWVGRKADGRFHPWGKIMRLVLS